MTRIDRRLRLWAWIAQRQAAATVQGEEAVIALQSRAFPENALMSFIFGSARGGVEVSDQTIPGPGGDLPIRIYRAGGPATGRLGRDGPDAGQARARPGARPLNTLSVFIKGI